MAGQKNLRTSVASSSRSVDSGPGLPLRQGPRPRGLLRRRLLLGGAAALALCAPAWAGPEGERVMRGNVNFARQLGLTQITASNRAIINWSSFNVGVGETVQFIQPSATSRVLNRITGADPTQIQGSILANGIVYIVNPAGVYFRQGALVNVGGIFAGAAHLADADFIAGRNQFTGIAGEVRNEGVINASRIAMIGQNVVNAGELNAPGGTVMMAAGDGVYIGERGGNFFARVNNDPSSAQLNRADRAGVENSGTINAPGGRVGLVTGDMYALAARNTGTVRARDVSIDGGRGTVEVSGAIDVSARDGERTGGTVRITGGQVNVRGASIDASGITRGGTIEIGGGLRGQGDLRNAHTTIVGPGSILRADATARGGAGGTVVVYSSGYTGFYGTASARGGEYGRGGLIETSGFVALDVRSASITASADKGVAGVWLLDPRDVTIDNGGTFANPFQPSAGNTVVDVTTLTTALAGGTSVTITTNDPTGTDAGNITINQPIAPVMTTAATLTLRAANNVNVNAPVTAAGTQSLSLVFSANDQTLGDDANTSAGSVFINQPVSIGGTLVSQGVGITLGGGTISSGGTQTYTGPVTLSANTTLTASTATFSSTVNANASGAQSLTITGNATFSGNVGLGQGLRSLDITGNTLLNANVLRTTNAAGGSADQNFGGTVTIGLPNDFTANIISTGGIVTFNGAVNGTTLGEQGLAVIGNGVVNAPIGNTVPLSIFGISLVSVLNTPSISTTTAGGGTAEQFFGGNATIMQNLTCTATSGTVGFGALVDAAVAGTQSLTVNGGATFTDDIGSVAPLSALSITGSTMLAGNAFTTNAAGGTGDQSYGSLVLNSAPGTIQTLTATGGGVTFNGALNANVGGAQGVNIVGNSSFNAAVGTVAPLSSIAVSGTSAINTASITTTNTGGDTGNQSYVGNVTLGGVSGTISSLTATGGTLTFGGTVNAAGAGTQGLTIAGPAAFGGSLGNTGALSALTLGSTASFTGASTVATSSAGGGTGNQTYTGAVTIGGAAASTVTFSSNTGAINFTSTLNSAGGGARNVAVNTAGVTTFGGIIGGVNALGTLSTNAAGSTTLGAGTITAGGTNFGDAVTLTANTTINDAVGVTFGSTVNSDGTARSLDVNSAGTTAFNGAVGGTAALSTLTTDAAGSTHIGANVSTTGTQTYNDDVTLTGAASSNVTFVGTTVTFGDTLDAGTAGSQGFIVTGNGAFTGAVGGAAALGSLSVSGTATLPSSVTTSNAGGNTGNQTYTQNLTLAQDTTLTATGGTLAFGGTVNGTGAGTESLTITAATTTFGGSVGAGTALESLAVTGDARLDGASINTTGAAGQSISGTLTLGGNPGDSFTLSSGAGDIALNGIESAAGGARALTLNSSGLTTVGIVGATGALSTLTTDTGGTLAFSGATITTTGAQSYGENAVLNTDVSFTAGGAGVAFGGTVDGLAANAQSLTVNGPVQFGGAVGGTTPFSTVTLNGLLTLASNTAFTATNLVLGQVAGGGFNLTLNATTGVTLGGNISAVDTLLSNAGLTCLTAGTTITTTSSQTYTGATKIAGTVGQDVTLIAGGDVNFGGTLDSDVGGARGIVINTSSATIFGGDVGGTNALSAVTTDAGGTLSLSSLVNTTGNQTYGESAVTLTQDTTLTSSTGSVDFAGTIDGTTAGTESLTINASATLGGAVGSTTSLEALTVTGGALINGGSVTTTGDQSYGDQSRIGQSTTLTGTTITFTGDFEGNTAGTETLTIAGNADFQGSLGSAVSFDQLSVSGTTLIGGDVFTAGTQTYTGAVTLTGAAGSRSLTASSVTFSSTVDAMDAAVQGLSIAGDAIFTGAVGATNALSALGVTGTAAIDGGQVVTSAAGGGSGDQTYGGAVTVSQNSTFTTAAGGTARFNGTLDGTSVGGQSIDIVGNAAFANNVGSINALGGLAISGATAMNAASVTTTDSGGGTGEQTYLGAMTLGSTGGSTTLDAGAGPITLGQIDGDGVTDVALTLNSSSNTTLNGSIGSVTPIGSLTTNAAGSTLLGTPVLSTVGAATFGDNVVLTADTVITAGTDVIFSGTLDSDATARSLSVNAAGVTFFTGAVGSGSALSSLTTDAAGVTRIEGGAVNTTGDQNYGDAVFVDSASNTTEFVSTGGTVSFTGSLDVQTAGEDAILITGNAAFAGPVGSAEAPDTLTVTGTTELRGSTINTVNAQSFAGAVTLGGAPGSVSTLTSEMAGVSFGSTVDSASDAQAARGLTINAPGTVVFTGAVGSTGALASLTTDAGGTTQLDGGSVTTTGPIFFGDNVAISQSTTFGSGGGDITFGGNLTGPFNITLDAGTGLTTFNGTVGELLTAIGTGTGAAITLNSTGATVFNGIVVAASGIIAQGDVTFVDNATFFVGDTNSMFNGNVTIDGAVLNFRHNVTFGTDINDSIILTGNSSAITSDTANITVNSRIDGAQNLSIDADSGEVFVNGAIGTVTPLTGLTLGGSTIHVGAGSILTAGDISFSGAVNLTAQNTITTGNGNLTFGSTVNGGFDLVLDAGSGLTSFQAAVGNTAALGDGVGAALTINSTGLTDFSSTVNTTSGILAEGAVTFRNDVIIGDGDVASVFNGNVTLNRSTLGDADVFLFVAADGVTFGSSVAGEDLLQLNGTASNVGFSITSTNADLVFNSRIEGAQDLVVNSGTAQTLFVGQIGGADPTTAVGDGIGRAIDVQSTGNTVFTSGARTNSGIRTVGPTSLSGTFNFLNGDTATNFDHNTTLAGANITAADSVTFGDAVTDTVTLTTGDSSVTTTGTAAPILFRGTVDGAQTLTVTTANTVDAGITFGSTVGATAPLTRLVTSAGVLSAPIARTTLNGNITTVNGVDMGQNLVLNANTLIAAVNPAPTNLDGQMIFRGTINSQSAAAPRTFAVTTTASRRVPLPNTNANDANNIAFRNYRIPIVFGGSIGNTAALQSLSLNFNPTGSIDTIPSNQVPTLSTIVFSPRIDANGFILQSDITSTLLNSTNFTITLANNGIFTQGFNEKILVFGSLAINVPGATGLARIGDITTLRALTVNASTIQVRSRGQGFIAGYSTTNQGIYGQDTGTDYVAGTTIAFNGNVVVTNQAGTGAGTLNPSFATPSGTGITGVDTFVQRAFGGGDLRDQFLDRTPPGGVIATNRFIAFDLQSRGPTNQNISETIAAFSNVDVPPLPQTTAIGGALIDQLKEIAIYVSPLSTEALIEFLVGRDLYNDVPRFTNVSESDRTVSASRLSYDIVVLVLDQYRAIKNKSDVYQNGINDAFTRYAADGAAFDAQAFCDFVRSSGSPDTQEAFAKLGELFANVDQLGLGPIETLQSKKAIVTPLVPTDLSPEQLVAAVTACGAAPATADAPAVPVAPAALVSLR